jgi:hypothetical protein
VLEALTGAVGFEAFEAEPPAFRAVTTTRSRFPRSARVARYDERVALRIATQRAPRALQRCQAYRYVSGVVPVQRPRDARSVPPTTARPSTRGAAALRGFVTEAPVTAAVASEVAVAESNPAKAVTATISVAPTSLVATVYEDAVAPAIARQLPLRQRRHSYEKRVGVPLQVPLDAVSLAPTLGRPEIDGRVALASESPSSAAAIVVVAAEAAEAAPALFVAVTSTWSRAPTSTAVTEYELAVAPAMFVQFPPDVSQRFHW